MTWPDFLKAISQAPRLTLVGPVLNEPPKTEDPVIYVDGGARFRGKDRLSFAVGDGDSGDTPLDHRLPAAKDYSDLAFVLRALPESVRELHMYGFWGGRPDHHMINFGEVHAFLKSRKPGSTVEWRDGHVVKAVGASGPLTLNVHGTFSVMTLEATRLSIRGECAYQLSSPTLILPLSSYGLSNRGHGKIEMAGEGPYFIFLNEDG